MFPRRILVLIALLFYYMHGLVCQDSTTLVPNSWTEKEEFEYDPNQPHCYRFTWLGPTYDNTSHVNGTCKDLKLKDTPCKQPFVITYDGSEPDLEILWVNHKNDVLCSPRSGSCVKYMYYFNGDVLNITYMCAKAISLNEGPVTSGCYSQYNNGYEIRACVCTPESNMIEHRPCNAADINKISTFVMLIIIAIYSFI